jgi:recombination protein U
MPEESSVKIMGRTANRGKYLEDWVEQANHWYNDRNQAVIYKIPTPWKIQRNFQPYTNQYAINYAFPEKKSTVDFGGTAQKKSIWFDVKVTKLKTSFPLRNVHEHQIEYLKKVHQQGGKAFLLIHSEILRKTWLLWIEQLLEFLSTDTRKSITFEWLDERCDEVVSANGLVLDYLPLVFKHDKEGEKE